MFKLFRRSKSADHKALIERIAGKSLRYVSERDEDGMEIVVGKSGALILRNEQLLVYASQDVIFRADVATLTASELMSRDGVILQGADLEHGGTERTIIAHYTDYLQRTL